MTTEFKRDENGKPLISVGLRTNPGDAAGAIKQALRERGECRVVAAGRAAMVACKALWYANKFHESGISVRVQFSDLAEEEGTRYGFAFIVEPKG